MCVCVDVCMQYAFVNINRRITVLKYYYWKIGTDIVFDDAENMAK